MVNNKWRKVKLALRLNTCLYVPKSQDDSSSSLNNDVDSVGRRFSDVVALSPTGSQPTTPTPSSSGLRLPKSSPKSSKRTCAICLTAMKPGQGHAIFTAECSHSFHFHCITSNVRHGNRICPICRANWKEVPFENPSSELANGRSRNNLLGLPGDDAWRATLLRRLPSQPDPNRPVSLPYYASEPAVFDDDEVCDHQHDVPGRSVDTTKDASDDHSVGTVEVTTYPETSSVSRGTAVDNFAVLIHLKAPFVSVRQSSSENHNKLPPTSPNCRASIDLVTVLDGSGSMGGTKLALLKRAMGFVIQNLGPSDRLSVIAFSSTARRIFPLRLMTETGKQEALQAVNSLKSNGGTNIAEGLRKGAKVIVDRKWKNPVASIILLSDGQDTYTVPVSSGGINLRADYRSLLPASAHRNNGSGPQIPVHAFGFGVDHDAASMHSISEISGGTFSFIECEGVIQDAFAQCIGGLLSVVVQELSVSIECIHPGLEISSIKAGSYRTRTEVDSRRGCIDVGDLYAEEERDFLITTNISSVGSTDDMKLLKVQYSYKDPVTKHLVTLEEPVEVKIHRPEVAAKTVVSIEVDRQRNRLAAAEAMAAARIAAERGDLGDAVAVLDTCRKTLSESISALSGDQLCVSLCAELREMQERMANRRVYEASGRAYVLSGLSSHSWQRATARGDSTETTSLVHAYQTPSMVDMVTRSQTMIFGNPSQQRKLRQAQSFPARPRPR